MGEPCRSINFFHFWTCPFLSCSRCVFPLHSLYTVYVLDLWLHVCYLLSSTKIKGIWQACGKDDFVMFKNSCVEQCNVLVFTAQNHMKWFCAVNAYCTFSTFAPYDTLLHIPMKLFTIQKLFSIFEWFTASNSD